MARIPGWVAALPTAGGIRLDARQFGPEELKLVIVQMDHFFDWAMGVLADKGYRVDRRKRLVEGAGSA